MSDQDVRKVELDIEQATSADELIAQSDLTPEDIDRAEEAAKLDAKGKAMLVLAEYQRLIVECTRRYIAMMVCRQGGKTFASTLRIARKLSLRALKYYILSRSERQSANAISQLAAHLRAVEKVAKAQGKLMRPSYARQGMRVTRNDGSAYEYSRLSVRFPNGSSCIGLPASPDTVVGISGSVYADEFALHKDSREIYGRLFPILTRSPHYELLITSTPRGAGNKFYDIMTGQDYADIFFRVTVTILDAIAQGLVIYDHNGDQIRDDAGIERLRKALKDDDKWAEEYLVQFVNDVLALLTHELIGRCEAMHLPGGKPYNIQHVRIEKTFDPSTRNLAREVAPTLGGGRLYVGHDIARVKHLSVIWLDEEIGGELWARALIEMKNLDFDTQEEILWQYLSLARMHRAGIDATGLGGRTAERAFKKFPDIVVPVNFGANLKDHAGQTHKAKSLVARTIMERHQGGLDHYPVMDLIREDFGKVKRKRTAQPDSFTYFADDEDTGHADIFTAKALSDLVYQELNEWFVPPDGVSLGRDVRNGMAMHADDDVDEDEIAAATAGRGFW